MTVCLRRKTALTLIELTLVTLLLLTIVGLSIPLFKKTFSDLSVKNASFNICKLINYAQEMSVLERTNFKITFDLQNGKYQLLEINTSVKPAIYKKVQGKLGKLFSLPQGAIFKGEKKEIFFYPDGHCDEFKINVLIKNQGYSVAVKRFGNMPEVKEVNIE